MKQTQLIQGGWTPNNDDIQFIQDGVLEVVESLVKAYSVSDAKGFRLWGLEMTLSNNDLTLTWTAGAVGFFGEVYKVDAGTLNRSNTSTESWMFIIQNNWGQSEYVSGSNGPGFYNTRNDKKATLFVHTPQSYQNPDDEPFTSYNAPYLKDVVHSDLKDEILQVSDIYAEDISQNPVVWNTTLRNVSYKVDRNTMHVNYHIEGSLASAAMKLFLKLPEGKVSDGRFGTVFAVGSAFSEGFSEPASDTVTIHRSQTFSGTIRVTGHLVLRIQ